MKKKVTRYLKEIILFTLVMVVFSNGISLYRSLDLNKKPLSLNYSLVKDKPVLVHFWAIWCPICRIEAQNIQTIAENFEVITIAVKSGSDKDIQEYLKSNNLDFKFINDNDGYLAQKFGISVYPTTIVYDKEKNVVFSDVGYTSTWGLWLRMWWASF